jgi:DNA-directed RNA polymerase II subunit RPB2
MNFYKDTWDVIDNYFSTTPYFLTKHHLDSYNDFVANKVLSTVKVLNNSFIVIKNENNTKNTINTYIGGLEGKDIFINKPTIVENGEARLLYPNEARLRDMTYQSEVFANIHVAITQEIEGQNDKVYEKVFNNVKIGALPIMLHSKLCVLHDQPEEVLREMGECQYDQGGYFVVDGKEKVIVAQERIATNRIFISKSKDLKYSHEGLIRCTSIENPLFPKTTYLYVNDVRDNSDMIDNAISIAIPNVTRNIPIFVLFRALGIESDKDILEYITYDVNDISNKNIIEFLRYSVIDNKDVYTQEEALNYIANFVEYKSLDKLKYILVNDLFPNVGISYKNKAMFLGHIVKKIVKVCLGALPITDRDNYMYKRVDISGFLLANLFRDYYNQFRNFVRSKIDQVYHFGPWRESGIENLINRGNLNDIFNYHIIEDGLRKSLKGSWGKITSKEQQDYKDLENIKQEVVQDLNRFSYAGCISHLRRCNTPLDPTAVKMVGPHKLHTSQFGIMCPCESPDGASIGLLKNFAILTHVTFDIPVESIKQCLKEHGLLDIKDIPVAEVKNLTKVLVNSNWVGVCKDAPQMYKLLKLLKRNALINIYTSVSWDIFSSEINILTESGRCCRPTYVVRNGNELVVSKFLEDLKAKKPVWIDLIKGDLVNRKDFDPFFDGYISPKKIIEKVLNRTPQSIDEIIEILETTQSAIEYSDVEETNGHLIAMDYDEIIKNNRKFTHCEIHASTMLSAVAVNTPFSDHNQAPRNIFSSGQCKQAIGVFATNYNNRIDTMVYTMNYAHRPITATRYGAYTNFNTMGNGQNLIVAVATYTGYNQEDSIVFNKTSVERGMFNLTYYKNMVDGEDENKRDNEAIRFANPLKLIEEGKNMTGLKFANYNKLDENGFPIVNSYIHEGDAIIGRCKVKTEYVEEENSKNNIFNNKIKREVYEDKSVIADKTVSGIIDKVFVYFDDHNRKKLKIRFRKNRVSEIGDKNCCYDKMTEVLTDKGWVLFKDLTKEHDVATLVGNKLVYQKPSALQEYDFDGHLYKVDSGQVKLLVTDNHRMYVRKYSRYMTKPYSMLEAQECNGRILYYKKNVDNFEPQDPSQQPCFKVDENNNITHFIIENERERLEFDITNWLTVFGIYLAEGSIGGQGIVNIAAFKQRVKDALDTAIPNIGFDISKLVRKDKDVSNEWRIYNTTLATYLHQFGTALHKYLPDWVWCLSREQCRHLIHSMCLGDGHISTSGTQQYDTSSKRLADDFQRLCLHAGWSCNKHLKMPEGATATDKRGHVYKANADNWRLSIVTKQNEPIVNGAKWKHIQDGWETYQGKVYCCTVPEGEGVLYVRREGYPVWCGNSRAG